MRLHHTCAITTIDERPNVVDIKYAVDSLFTTWRNQFQQIIA